MATKTLYNNPTVNPFDLLQVDEQPTEKRTRTQPAKKADDAQFLKETPAERGQRRAKAKAEKDKQQEAVLKQQQKDLAEAALLGPDSGFQVQKGSQSKKPVDGEKKKTLNREQFLVEKPNPEDRPKKPKTPTHYLAQREGSQYHADQPDKRPRDQARRSHYNQGENATRPLRHEGFDKHSGGKTPNNKNYAKRDGQGGANWGDPVADWNKNQTKDTPLSGGWDDKAQPNKVEKVVTGTNSGWGDEGEVKPTKPAGEAEETPLSEKKEDTPARPPAWDEEEGHGKMLLDEYQAKVAAQREKALAELAPAKEVRTVEAPVDLSKFSYKETSDDKDKKSDKDKKNEKKKQQRVGQTQADLTDVFDIRFRGTGGRGRGSDRGAGRGRGGDRPPRTERAEGEQAQTERPATPKGERRGGYQGRGRRVQNNSKNFPDLSAAKTVSK